MEGGGGKEGRRATHRLNDEHGYRLQDECIGCKVTSHVGHGSLVYITVSPATCSIYQGDLQYRQHVYLSETSRGCDVQQCQCWDAPLQHNTVSRSRFSQ